MSRFVSAVLPGSAALPQRVVHPVLRLDGMYDLHKEAAEQHELAAKAHRTAAEHNEKGDDDAARWHSERALEYADHAYKLAKEAHNRSGQIVSL